MVLDVEAWASAAGRGGVDEAGGTPTGPAAERAAEILADQGWRVVVVEPGHHRAAGLGGPRAGGGPGVRSS